MESHIAALKIFVVSVETLRVEALDPSPDPEPQHVVSRKFHRYVTMLVNALVPIVGKDAMDSTSDLDRLSGKVCFYRARRIAVPCS